MLRTSKNQPRRYIGPIHSLLLLRLLIFLNRCLLLLLRRLLQRLLQRLLRRLLRRLLLPLLLLQKIRTFAAELWCEIRSQNFTFLAMVTVGLRFSKHTLRFGPLSVFL